MSDIFSNTWWCKEEMEPHGPIFQTIRDLETRGSEHRLSMRKHLGLYMNSEVNDLNSVVGSRMKPLFGESELLNLNVIKSCIDTVAAKIASHHPRPMFTTEDGEHRDREKARGLERWTDGLFYRERLHTHHGPHIFIDAAIFGTGACKVYADPDENEVRLEWTWIGQLFIDEASSMFAPPRSMFQRMHVSRDVLCSRYPKFKAEIESLKGRSEDYKGSGKQAFEDVVEVIEAWHLPSGPKGKGGRHCICVDNVTLEDGPYTDDDFPFVFFRWGRTPLGFFGIGLARELHGLQIEIKKLLTRIQAAMNLTATVMVLKPVGTKISDDHFTNEIGNIVEYSGPKEPNFITPASMNSQVFQHLWRLRDAAYEIAGISQLSATGTKPAGIESGVALRTLNDFETQRFALLSRDWEEFYIEVARKAVKLAKQVYKGQGAGTMKWSDRDTVKKINWADVDLDEDAYVLRIYPTNMLPQTPAGKLATIEQMMGMQLVSQEEGRSLLDFPDIKKVMNLDNAAYEDLVYIFDTIWAEGEYIGPTPEMNLEMGAKMAVSYWLKAHKDRAPEQIRDQYTQWIEDAKELMAPPPPPPMPPGMEGMPPPGMEGMPPPGMEGMPPDMMGGPPPMAMGA